MKFSEELSKKELQLAKAAVRYAEYGMSVFPAKDKRPVFSWKEFIDRPASPKKVHEWFTGEYRGCQIAWSMGRDYVALDADTPEAAKHLDALAVPTYCRQSTPRGVHLIFKADTAFEVKNSAAPPLWEALKPAAKKGHNEAEYRDKNPIHLKIDVRGYGGYIIIGPSEGYRFACPDSMNPAASFPTIELWHLKHIGHGRFEAVQEAIQRKNKIERTLESVPLLDMDEYAKDYYRRHRAALESRDLVAVLGDIAGQVRKCRWQSDRKLTGCCPAHEDKRPSFFAELANWGGGDRLTLHCSAGCSFEQICAALNMSPREMFATDSGHLGYYQQEVQQQKKEPLEQQVTVDLKQLSREFLNSEDLPEFNPAKLPPIFRDHILELQGLTTSSPIMTTASLLGSFSAYCKGRVYIPDYFEVLTPNVWFLSISASGAFKSTSIQKGAHKFIADEEEALFRKKEIKKQIEELEGITNVKNIVDSLEAELIAIKARCRRLPGTLTWQGLIDHMQETSGGCFLLSEFAAWYDQLNLKYQGGIKAALTEAFDGVPIMEKTRSREVEIPRPFISIIGVSTAAFLLQFVTSMELDVKSGFFSRFLFFRPPKAKERPPAVPTDSRNIEDLKTYAPVASLFNSLGGVMPDKPILYRISDMTSEALELYEHYYQRILDDFDSLETPLREWLGGFVRRWPPYLFKLAMLMQPAWDIRSQTITVQALESAWSVLHYAIESTKLLYSHDLGQAKFDADAEKVLRFIARHDGRVTRWQLLKDGPIRANAKLVDLIIEHLEQSNRIFYDKAKPEKKLYELILAS